MTLGLDVLLVLFVAAGVVWLVRAFGRMRAVEGDAATAVLALACEHLPADRAEWGRAMCTELACIDGRTARWRFALGGVRAALSARLSGRMTGKPDLSIVVAGALVCLGLVVAALATYPALLGEPKLPLLLGALAVVLCGYTLIASASARNTTPAVRGPRATGLIAGVVLGVVWLVFAAAWWNLHGWPLVAAIVLPVVAGGYFARSTGAALAAVKALTRTALIAGLVVFVGSAIDAFVTAGGPYDTSQLDEFHHSGYTSLPAYWMGEDLAVAVMLLIFVPCLTVAVGSIGAVAVGLRPRTETTHRSTHP
jgi:hypothetical protein